MFKAISKFFTRKPAIETEFEDFTQRQISRAEAEIKDLKNRAAQQETMYDALVTERRDLKEEVEDLKIKKKIETEDIEHMVTMKLERVELEKDRAIMEAKEDATKKINEAEAKFNNELKEYLRKTIEQGEARYSEILKKLADVQVNVGLGHPGNSDT